MLVRHFPRWLSEEEKESLLLHFGATDVLLLPPRGKMVCAFVYHQGMCILWVTFIVKIDVMLLISMKEIMRPNCVLLRVVQKLTH